MFAVGKGLIDAEDCKMRRKQKCAPVEVSSVERDCGGNAHASSEVFTNLILSQKSSCFKIPKFVTIFCRCLTDLLSYFLRPAAVRLRQFPSQGSEPGQHFGGRRRTLQPVRKRCPLVCDWFHEVVLLRLERRRQDWGGGGEGGVTHPGARETQRIKKNVRFAHEGVESPKKKHSLYP